jgi:hypothetical protein
MIDIDMLFATKHFTVKWRICSVDEFKVNSLSSQQESLADGHG